MPNIWLEEDCRNLGLVLNNIESDTKTKNELVKYFRHIFDGAEGFGVTVEAGSVQVFVREALWFITPATRLSDGTLRYLCLLAILCHPNPPPLICIEEPELGLHPDLIVKLADLLREAAKRTQLIVTTHSDHLVDALSDTPESIVVCEKTNGRTSLSRLDAKQLTPWLEKYSLGKLWRRGDLGGNRW
jgi:predicted ATPase